MVPLTHHVVYGLSLIRFVQQTCCIALGGSLKVQGPDSGRYPIVFWAWISLKFNGRQGISPALYNNT